jgi:hypothetical protein
VLHPTTHAHHLGIIQHPTSIRVDISAYPLHPPIKIPGKSIPYTIQLAKKTIFAERKKTDRKETKEKWYMDGETTAITQSKPYPPCVKLNYRKDPCATPQKTRTSLLN